MDGVYDDRRYPGHRLQTLSLCWPSLPRYMLSLKNSLPDGYRGPMSHMRKSGSRRHERGHTAWVSRIRPFIRHSSAGGSGRVVVGLGIGSPPPQYSASFKAAHSPPPSPSAKRPPVLAGPCWTERTVYRQITNPFSLLLYLTRSNSPGPSVRGILFR